MAKKLISSILYTTSSEELQEEIEKDLEKNDPEKAKAEEIIDANSQESDRKRSS